MPETLTAFAREYRRFLRTLRCPREGKEYVARVTR